MPTDDQDALIARLLADATQWSYCTHTEAGPTTAALEREAAAALRSLSASVPPRAEWYHCPNCGETRQVTPKSAPRSTPATPPTQAADKIPVSQDAPSGGSAAASGPSGAGGSAGTPSAPELRAWGDLCERVTGHRTAGTVLRYPDGSQQTVEEFIAYWRKTFPREAHPQPHATAPQIYVMPVPDHCDRITWRGSYYSLPLKDPIAAPVGDVAQPHAAGGGKDQMSSADVIDRLKRHDIGSIDRAVALIERLAAQVAERDQTIEDLERAEMLARESSEWALRNQKQAEASAADYLARAERAEAEAARNAKDAERGRYLIEKAMLHSNGTDGESRWAIYVGKRDEPYPKSSPYYKGPPFATLTAAIDAALESRKPSTKGEPK